MLPGELNRRKRANSPFDIPYIGQEASHISIFQWLRAIFGEN
jgi:hypothetical protein